MSRALVVASRRELWSQALEEMMVDFSASLSEIRRVVTAYRLLRVLLPPDVLHDLRFGGRPIGSYEPGEPVEFHFNVYLLVGSLAVLMQAPEWGPSWQRLLAAPYGVEAERILSDAEGGKNDVIATPPTGLRSLLHGLL